MLGYGHGREENNPSRCRRENSLREPSPIDARTNKVPSVSSSWFECDPRKDASLQQSMMLASFPHKRFSGFAQSMRIRLYRVEVGTGNRPRFSTTALANFRAAA